MSSCHRVTRATPPCHHVTRAPSPTIGSRLHLLLLLLQLLLFLVSVLGFALLSSARFFALVFPEAARFYFFHDKSFAFYAALLLIFFVLSNSVGFLHAIWRRGWLVVLNLSSSLGSGPNRKRSLAAWGEVSSVHLSVHPSVHQSVCITGWSSKSFGWPWGPFGRPLDPSSRPSYPPGWLSDPSSWHLDIFDSSSDPS